MPRRAFFGDATLGMLAAWGLSPEWPAAAPLRLFDRLERVAHHPGPGRRLRAVVARHAVQGRAHAAWLAARHIRLDAPGRWAAARATVGRLPMAAAIDTANRLLNEVPYRTDRENYGLEDRWSTPFELLSHGGDCECFAIAKLVLLREAVGLAPERLRLVLLAATAEREAHAVLAVRAGSDFLVLDNRTDEILPSARLRDTLPLLAINEAGEFGYGPAGDFA